MSPHREGFVAGIYLGGTKAALVTADLEGRRLTAERIQAQAGDGADAMVERVMAAARNLIAQVAAHTATEIAAAAAVSAGAAQAGRILRTSDSPGRRLAELVRELGTQRVAVSNEVQAAALAEARWGTLAGDGPGIFVYLGAGLSMARRARSATTGPASPRGVRSPPANRRQMKRSQERRWPSAPPSWRASRSTPWRPTSPAWR
jgi:predicted NBD/HSP70 family sugar kinase